MVLAMLAVLELPAMAATGRISGRVSEGGGASLVGAVVEVFNGSTKVAEGTSAADGNYSIDVDNGTYNIVVNPPIGSGFTISRYIGFAVSGLTNLNVVLVRQAVTLSGVLRTSRGVPIPDADIKLNGPSPASTRTTSTGAFSLAVAPGTYNLDFSRSTGSNPDFPDYFYGGVSGLVLDADRTQDLTMPFTAARVSVIDPDGNPVSGTGVSLVNNYSISTALWPGGPTGYLGDVYSTGTTGADGTTTVVLVPHNPVTLRATPPASLFLSQALVTNLDARTGTNTVVVLQVDVAAVTSIAVTPANPHAPQGTTKQFTATATYTDGSKQNISSSVTWSSSDPSVATINAAGLATAIRPVTTTIRASLGSAHDETVLTVDPRELLTINVTPKNSTHARGSTTQFTATGSYSAGSTSDLTNSATWTSSAPTVATIGSTGLATARARGTTTISATSGSVSDSTDLTVGPSPLTVRAPSFTFVYGETIPATFTPTYEGLVNGDTQPATPATCTSDAHTGSNVGTYSITCSGAADPNYGITYAGSPVRIKPAPLTIHAPSGSAGYGSGTGPSYVGLVNGDPGPATPPTCTSGTVGTTSTSCSGAADPNYEIIYVGGTLTITAAPLSVEAPSASMTYGGSIPSPFIPTYSGFVNADTAASLTAPATCSTTASSSSGAGTYPITCSGASSPNYAITYVAGTLTITKAPLAVSADNASRPYGSTTALTATYAGFVNGDTVASLTTPATCSTTAVATSPAGGTYPITCSGAVSGNYTFTYTAGTLTIMSASLTVTADNKTRTYGQANPALTATISGFTNGDTSSVLTAQPTCSTTATAASPAGAYPIVCSGAAAANYTPGYVAGTLTITRAALTVQAPSASTTYGAGPPGPLTPTYSGFVNGDTAASLTTPATCGTGATAASPAGPYPITCSGATTPNYTVAYRDGTLTVNGAPLTITAVNASKIYGSATPALAATYSGFVNGDSVASLTSPATCSTTATAASPVGPYPITCGGAAGANYAISYVGGTLTIAPAPLTIRADDKTKTYGQPNPPLTWTISGVVNGDTPVGILGSQPTCTTPATAASAAGTYPITCGGANFANYVITYLPGILTVTPAALTVTADAETKVYGQANPALTSTISGFVNGDTPASLTTQATCATPATAASPAGSHQITCGGGVAANYSFAYGPGTLTITRAPLTVTADNASKAYGSANPALTTRYAGFVNGDTPASLTTPATCTSSATTTSAAGSTHPITCSGAASPNYGFAYVAGTLTVTKAPLTITAGNKTRVYGQPNPPLTSTIAGFVNGDTPASLTIQPTCTTPASAASPVGTYAITCSGAAAANYSFVYMAGTLTVTKAPLRVTADNKTRAYGAANPALTYSLSGFVNADTAAVVSGSPVLATSATTTSNAGTYPITVAQGTLAAANYSFTLVPGTMTVTRAPTSMVASPAIARLAPPRIVFPQFSARLRFGNPLAPVAGQPVKFFVGTTLVCTANTDATGLASCNGSITGVLSTVLSRGYDAVFDGSGNLLPSQAHGPLVSG